MVHKAQVVLAALKLYLVQAEHRVLLVFWDQAAQSELKDHKDHKDHKGIKDLLEYRVHPVQAVRV
jgi:hypothetical protein